MTAPCPNGHASGDPDWCDTCGAPMHGASPAQTAVATSAPEPAVERAQSAGAVPCPHCGATNAADNLFCESCGYDFVTGQTPEPVPVIESPGVIVESAGPASTRWVVVVEIDRAWHELKGELADRPLPSASTSTVSISAHTSLIGRTSQSRGLRPEDALDADTAVSRRHAQLVVDGEALSVVDLSSTNGTFVLARGVLPAADTVPLVSGVAHRLADGDQIFLGAWSRLTIRTS